MSKSAAKRRQGADSHRSDYKMRFARDSIFVSLLFIAVTLPQDGVFPHDDLALNTNVSRTASNSSFQSLKADFAGNLHLVWLDGSNDLGIVYSRWSGAKWSPPIPIVSGGVVCVPPSMTIASTGEVHLVWMMGGQYDCDIYYSNLMGDTWSKPKNISSLRGISQCPRVAIDSSGVVHVVWFDNAEGHLQLFHCTCERGIWSQPANTELVSGEFVDDLEFMASPALTADSRGNVHLVWTDKPGASGPRPRGLCYSRLTNESWSMPVSISSQTGSPTRPAICSDSEGNLHVTWQEHFSEVWYASNTGDTWSEPIRVDPELRGGLPAICVGADQEIHFAWTYSESDRQIYYCRLNQGNWSGITQVTSSPNGALFPAIAVDSKGNIHFTWMNWRRSHSEIFHRQGVPNALAIQIADCFRTFFDGSSNITGAYIRGDFKEIITYPNRANLPESVVVNEPRGEFVKIDVTATNEKLRSLLSDDPSVKQQAVDRVLAEPNKYAPPAIYAVAYALSELGKPDEALFWYYLGLLRATSDAYKAHDGSVGEAIGSLNTTFGKPFHEKFRDDWRKTTATREKVIAWDRQHARQYDARWIALTGMDAFSMYMIDFAPEHLWVDTDEQARFEMQYIDRAADYSDKNGDGKLSGVESSEFDHALSHIRRYKIQGNTVLYMNHPIPGVDTATFEVMGDQLYAKDRSNVYIEGHLIPGADPGSFKPIKGPYSRDQQTVFWGVVPMTVKEIDKFEVVYWKQQWLELDHETPTLVEIGPLSTAFSSGIHFTEVIDKLGLADDQRAIVGLAWARDGNAYYFGPTRVEEVDYDSFKVLDIIHAKDKYRRYCGAFPEP